MGSTTGRIGDARVSTSTYSYGNGMSTTSGRIGDARVYGNTYSYGPNSSSTTVRITPSPYGSSTKRTTIYGR